MSFSEGGAQSFFRPLTGRSATFIVDRRQDNLDFARTIAGLAASERSGCTVLDLDALYSSNAAEVFSNLQRSKATLRIPAPGADVDFAFSRLFSAPEKVIIIDSLNSLYHLLSMEDGRSRGRKFAFAVASLSYLAKTNAKVVMMTAYRRETFGRARTNRSISNLSDVTVSVMVSEGELTIRTERGAAWPGGRYSIPVPS